MVMLLDIPGLKKLVHNVGVNAFLKQLTLRLEKDFSRWSEFKKTPRHATHYDHGVLELMPTADEKYYAFKYVNGHPNNTQAGKLSVTALGMLADVESGYPILISEMTFLTALRTAATSALAVKYLKSEDYQSLAIVGTGAQSEFQVLAVKATMSSLKRIYYYDIDAKAMEKFARNLKNAGLELIACDSIQQAVSEAKLIITATAQKRKQSLFENDWIKKGSLILAIGGDCPGKTELGIDLLPRAKIIVEHTPQTLIEGELQHLDVASIYAELWQIITGDKPAPEYDDVVLFDGVGFAIEDYSALVLVYELLGERQWGCEIDMLPELQDPKDLFGTLVSV